MSAKDIHTQFKNVPNVQLRGNTFDVKHLDQFIKFDQIRGRVATAIPGVRDIPTNNYNGAMINQERDSGDDMNRGI